MEASGKDRGEPEGGSEERTTELREVNERLQQHIEDLRRSEDALRTSRAQLAEAMDLAGIVYWEVDLATGDFVFNDPFYALYGTTAEREGGYRMSREEYAKRFFHPDDLPLFQQVAEKRRLNTDPELLIDLEHRIIRRDGDVRHVLARIRVSRDASGRVTKHHGANQDITERKRSEEQLRKSEEKARRLAQENAIMAEIGRIISSTLDMNEVYPLFAEEVRKLIPFDRVGINTLDLGKGTAMLAYIAGKGVPHRKVGLTYSLEGTALAEMIRTGSAVLVQTDDILEVKTRFPKLVSTFEAGFRSIMDVPLFEKGQIIGALLLRSLHPNAYTTQHLQLAERVGRQIAGAIANAQLYSDRKRAEEEKAKLQALLLRAQKLETVGRLSGGIAHDFNNLLTPIIGNAEMALSDMNREDPLYEVMEEIRQAGKRAATLTRQLLAFSRRQILQPEVLDLNGVVRGMDRMLRRIIGEDIELWTMLSPELGPVEADIGQVEQVVMNLAVNAREAMPGGGKLTIETKNVELDEDYARNHAAVTPGPYVMLAVSDTGVGMSMEIQEQLFDPFFTTKEKEKGAGLGLSTVYGIVKQSKGHIWVYSEPGKGSTFKIYLPWVEEPGHAKEKAAKTEESLQGSETILMVEDDETVRKMTLKILQKHGYTVLCARNPQEAIHLCREHKEQVQLTVTDVVMPGMSGKDLADEVKRIRPGMKVLFTSGYTDDAIVHHGVLAKGMAFIQKPFTPEGLARKVREVLGARNSERGTWKAEGGTRNGKRGK
ncbi:MAG: ATP-binding protein [Thermodesulfobacteriota bacterium]